MVAIDLIFLSHDPSTGGGPLREIAGPKIGVSRVPVPEEEIVISKGVGIQIAAFLNEDADEKSAILRVIFVRHIPVHVPTDPKEELKERPNWPSRAAVGVIVCRQGAR